MKTIRFLCWFAFSGIVFTSAGYAIASWKYKTPEPVIGTVLSSSNPSSTPTMNIPEAKRYPAENKTGNVENIIRALDDYRNSGRNELEENNSGDASDKQHLSYNINKPTKTPEVTLEIPLPETNTTVESSPTANIGSINMNPMKKNHFLIALLGDSMTETLGYNFPNLIRLLKARYPDYTFSILNYGQGSTDLLSGLDRLTKKSEYQGKQFPPLLSFKPDIIVVESFGYNHWSSLLTDLDKQWVTFAKIKDTVREKSPDSKMVFAATIACNGDIFGDGILNWPSQRKWDSCNTAKAYLQNTLRFAQSEKIPAADAYSPSLDANGNGNKMLIDPKDNIHPSEQGRQLFAEKVLKAIEENKLID